MRKQLPDGNATFAALGELWPIVSHWYIELKQAAAMSDGHGRGGHSLGYRKSQAECVFLPRLAGRPFATPQIDNFGTMVIDGAGRASLAALSEISLECMANRRKLWTAMALDDHAQSLQLMGANCLLTRIQLIQIEI